jgi:hypothetical protein
MCPNNSKPFRMRMMGATTTMIVSLVVPGSSSMPLKVRRKQLKTLLAVETAEDTTL